MTILNDIVFLLFTGFSVWTLIAIKDLALVRQSIRAVLSGENPDSNLRPNLKVSKEIKALLQLFLLSNKQQKSEQGVNERLFGTGQSIAENSERISAVSENGVKIFKQELAPALKGVFLGVTKENSTALDIVESLGLPLSRIESSILNDVQTSQSNSIIRSDEYGFIGISYLLTMVVDLENDRKLLIWLGFREGLAPESRLIEIAQGIAEQLRASMVTAAKAGGAIEKINQDKDFLLGMSHDLRSPASSALYALYNLKNQKKDIPELADIESYLQDQLQIIDNVLDLARHEQHLLISKQSEVNLKTLVVRVVDRMKWHASQKNIEISTANLENLSLDFDEAHLERILQNYLNNAVRHTNNGKIVISLLETEEDYELIVEDNGCGVKFKDRELLFQKFSSLSTLTNTGGFGLGLLICSNLAKINNAKAIYRPSEDGGSIFGISICKNKVKTKQKESKEIRTCPKAVLKSILLIEDHSETARALSRQLSVLSDNISHVKKVSDAKSLLSKSNPSLVVSDYQLGEQNVSSLVSITIPWIIITGDVNQVKLPSSIPRDKVRILSKPVEKEKLISIAQELAS